MGGIPGGPQTGVDALTCWIGLNLMLPIIWMFPEGIFAALGADHRDHVLRVGPR